MTDHPGTLKPARPQQGATPQQMIAADPAHSAWVGANAGTGKTRVLIDRITRLLLAGAKPGRILCLTFTKAAAAEMADRLSARLGLWAMLDDDKLNQELTELLGQQDDRDLNVARRLFAECLEFPGGLKIQTIHAFCESLLKRFPLEADIPPHFSVIDERTAAETLLDARDRMLADAFSGNSPALEEALNTITALVDEQGFSDIMGELIGKRNRLGKLLARYGGLDGLFSALQQRLNIDEGLTEDRLIREACNNNNFAKPALLEAAHILAGGGKSEQKNAALMTPWLNDESQREELLENYLSVFIKKTDGLGKAETSLINKGTREKHPHVLTSLLQEQDRLLTLQEMRKSVRIAAATKALLRLGTALLQTYDNAKTRKALVDYDDLILKTKSLLSADGGVSWALFKLDGGLDHILVDEAQDTSPEQWEIIRVLADEFFAGQTRREENRSLFVVGDEKQSIYSFQGADPEGFGRMKAYFADKAKAAEKSLQSVELAQSYRSTPSILQAVDAVFDQPEAAHGVISPDRKTRHLAARTGEAGLVELWPAIKPAEVEEELPWDAPLDQKSAQSPEAQVADTIADKIKGWLDSGEALSSQGRPIRPDDIMILVRERGRFMETMVRALKVRRIPVAGTDRMILTDQLAIQDLMAVAAFVLLPEDDLNTATVLKTPLIGLDEDALFDIAYNRQKGETVWQSLKQKKQNSEQYHQAARLLEQLLAEADFTPPYEFFAGLLSRHGGRKKIVARLGPEVNDPIDEFLGLALAYEREHSPSLQGFLHWLKVGSAMIKRDLEQGEGEVRVMTVHGSKGLQGNIVFLPDTCRKPSGNRNDRLCWDMDHDQPIILWPGGKENEEKLSRSLKDHVNDTRDREYRRLLYVAMTRASDRLYITGWEKKTGRDTGCWYDLIASALKDKAAPFTFGDEEGLRLENPQEKEPKGQALSDTTPPAMPLPDWASRPAPKDPLPPDPLVPSRPTEEEPPAASPFTQDTGTTFKRGRIIHRLLQSLPDIAPAERPEATRRFLAQPGHDLTEQEQTDMAGEVLAILNHPGFSDLFGPGSLAEVPIIGTLGQQVISAQVDRLVVRDNDVMIVDYKTNRPPPRDSDGVADSYRRQMAAYRAALQAIYPGKAVRCLLLWTDGPDLMELNSDILDPFAP